MPGGFRNKPKIFRGAFLEYGRDKSPLQVVFQFNPVQLSRSRSISFSAPNETDIYPPPGETDKLRRWRIYRERSSLREYHKKKDNLADIQKGQVVNIEEESISFEIRLDATDKLNEGDPDAQKYGIAPQLAHLELMTYPLNEWKLKQTPGSEKGYSFTGGKGERPPIILFIWGRNRVLPVNINSMNITEMEFNTRLDPVRAAVSVNVTVIEGKNKTYIYTRDRRKNLAEKYDSDLSDAVDIVIPK
jgi:hypothetical protein